MNDYQEFTPDERALKAELEKLAGQIHADSDFVTGLEQTLMQHEAMQSADVVEFPRRRWSTPFLTLAAALAIFLCLGTAVLVGGFSMSGGDEAGDLALVTQPVMTLSDDNSTAISGSETAIAVEVTQPPNTEVAVIASPTVDPVLTQDGAHQGMLDTQEALASATATTTTTSTGTPQPSMTPPGTATPAGTMAVFQPTMGASMAAGVIAPIVQPPISILGATTTPGPGQFVLPQTLPPATQVAMQPTITLLAPMLTETPRPSVTPLLEMGGGNNRIHTLSHPYTLLSLSHTAAEYSTTGDAC